MRQAFPELLLEAHIPMATQNARRRWMLDQRQAFSLMFWVPGIAMIRLNFQLKLNYQVLEHDADFFFYIHAANTSHQQVSSEHLTVSEASADWEIQQCQDVTQRCLRVSARPGTLTVHYEAIVEISHHKAEPGYVSEVPVRRLPLEVMQYVYPSRYCQSDRLSKFAVDRFGHLPQGYTRAQAICDWVRQNVTFRSNTSIGTTSAVDTLIERVGVCRDFAHLMIAICRAINLPARFVTGTDYGADPALGPSDFHAYVEVYLGYRWFIFDPSGTSIPMGLMRIATGRDAADVAFATIFGSVISEPAHIHVQVEHSEKKNWEWPVYTSLALSTE
ncbi:transglutaminase [Comamonas testosteroni TK102]|uniref:Transglutaminase domain protein n=4 Tax=Comamonas TaxID=283 RepID=B7WYJ0_COMTK|nr:transglutaminase [Comamonas testosteroni TK102]EED66123.1 transglutaminase domain protein [Comamonas testosteroni KF-1]